MLKILFKSMVGTSLEIILLEKRHIVLYQQNIQNLKLTSRDQYPDFANEILRLGDPSSSAGGEQPKFQAVVDDGIPVIVKFSPKISR